MSAALAAYHSSVAPRPPPQQMPSQRGHGVMAVARSAAEVASVAHTLWKLGVAAAPLVRSAGAFLCDRSQVGAPAAVAAKRLVEHPVVSTSLHGPEFVAVGTDGSRGGSLPLNAVPHISTDRGKRMSLQRIGRRGAHLMHRGVGIAADGYLRIRAALGHVDVGVRIAGAVAVGLSHRMSTGQYQSMLTGMQEYTHHRGATHAGDIYDHARAAARQIGAV